MAKKSRNSRSSSSRKMKHTRKHKTHSKRTNRKSHRKNHRKSHRRGGSHALNGAPTNYHLSGDWSSKMSLGQGADYFKYHEGQHGGGLSYGNFPEAVMDAGLPTALRGPAHIGGIDKAIADIHGLSDLPTPTHIATPTHTTGTTSGGGNNNNTALLQHSLNGALPFEEPCRQLLADVNVAFTRKPTSRKAPRLPLLTKDQRKSAPAVVRFNESGGRRHHKTHSKKHSKSKKYSRKNNKTHRRSYGGSLGYAPFPNQGMLLSSPTQYAQAGLNPEWKTDVAFADAKIRESQ